MVRGGTLQKRAAKTPLAAGWFDSPTACKCEVAVEQSKPTPRRSSVTSGLREVAHVLVLTRKSNQSIMIGDDIEVTVLSIMGEKVRIGIQAPRDIPVFRKEVYLEIQQERALESAGGGESFRDQVDTALRRLGDS
jgi:carbon storage regulator